MVGVEVLVFERNRCGTDAFGYIGERDNRAFFFPVNLIKEVCPGSIEYLGGFGNEARVNFARTRKVFGEISEDTGGGCNAENSESG